MENSTDFQEATALNSSDEGYTESEMSIPVPELAKDLELYKISQYLLNYTTVPIAVWGWFGNLISLR